MADNDQVRPLTPSSRHLSSDNGEYTKHVTKLRRKRFIKIFSCLSVTVLLLAATVLILMLTVFRVKNPIINLNGATITNLINGSMPTPGSNMSLTADVSIKNPNYVSFKYRNTSTALYYHGKVVGDAYGPPGRSRARRTTRMNVTVDIIIDRFLSDPNIFADIGSGVLTMSSYSRVDGKMNIIGIKKHVVVEMNCTMSVNFTSESIQHQECKRHVEY